MTRLPIISGKRLLNILKKHGYKVLRQKGSHVFVESSNGKSTAIPVHGNEDLGRGILKSILRDLELEIQDLAKTLYK